MDFTFTVNRNLSPAPGVSLRLGGQINRVFTTNASGQYVLDLDPLFNGVIPIEVTDTDFNLGTTLSIDMGAHDGVTIDDTDITMVAKVDTLVRAQTVKNGEIDRRTQELVAQGFTYDSQTFSLSDNAQKDWLARYSARDQLTYPKAVTTKDDQEYSVANEAAMAALCLTALGLVTGHIDSGRALKLQVNAAADIAAVNAVTDTR